MNTKFFVFITLVFVSLVTAINIPGDNSKCDLDMTEACKQNTRFVTLRRLKPDYSVAFSQYMTMNNLTFAEKYTMTELNYNGVAPDPEEFEMPTDTSMSHLTTPYLRDAVSTPLEGEISDTESIKVNKYVVYAAIDLMNLVYSMKDPEGRDWRFSTEQLYLNTQDYDDETELAGYNNIREVMDYLATTGVCLEQSFNDDPALCERYKIDGFRHLYENATNQGILEKLLEEPLYVQVGIHPLYYQFYTPECEDPIHAGYIKPNLAGVLTGYNFDREGKEYWELYIRRHGGDKNNRVKLGCMFEKDGVLQPPAAGISSKIYRIEKGEDLSPVGRAKITFTVGSSSPVSTTEAFKELFDNVVQDNDNEVAIDSRFFDCNDETASIDLTFIQEKGINKLIMVGDNDYSCVNMDNLEIDFADVSADEIDGFSNGSESGRRLAASEPKRFENKKFLSITIGKNKYKNQNLYIKNCDKLTLVSIGEGSFSQGSEFILENNKLLVTLIVRKGAFGSGKIDESSVTLNDLPILEFMNLDEGAFDNIVYVTAKNVHPVYIFNMVISGKDAFRNLDVFDGEFDNNHPSLVDYFVGKRKIIPTTAGPSSEPNL